MARAAAKSGREWIFGAAHEASAELLRIADFTPPSRFLETILTGPMQGRRKLYSRLGMSARDAIDELMNSALEFERDEAASLDRLLSWFSRGTVDVQRDPGRIANEVRVMTVHGAKGLEAPVVILADATADPARLGRTPTVDIEVAGVGVVPFLRPKKDEISSPFDKIIADEEKRDLEEHMRLLYVALTRAADRLIVSGVEPKPKRTAPIRGRPIVGTVSSSRRMEASMHGRRRTTSDSGMRRHRCAAEADEGQGCAALRRHSGVGAQSGTAEARPPRPLAPSAIAVDDEDAPPPSEAMRAAALRGTWIHQLLEKLPPVEPERAAEQRSAGWGAPQV